MASNGPSFSHVSSTGTLCSSSPRHKTNIVDVIISAITFIKGYLNKGIIVTNTNIIINLYNVINSIIIPNTINRTASS